MGACGICSTLSNLFASNRGVLPRKARDDLGRRGTEMTTFLMIICVIAVATGAAILGWLARSQQFGFSDDVDLIDRGEVEDPKNGD